MTQRNKQAKQQYVRAKHNVTLWMMTQRVRQKGERGKNKEADGGEYTKRTACDYHQRNVK